MSRADEREGLTDTEVRMAIEAICAPLPKSRALRDRVLAQLSENEVERVRYREALDYGLDFVEDIDIPDDHPDDRPITISLTRSAGAFRRMQRGFRAVLRGER